MKYQLTHKVVLHLRRRVYLHFSGKRHNKIHQTYGMERHNLNFGNALENVFLTHHAKTDLNKKSGAMNQTFIAFNIENQGFR